MRQLSRVRPATTVLAALILAGAWCMAPRVPSAGEKGKSRIEVRSGSLLERVDVIGTLGKPLFTSVRVRGEWRYEGLNSKTAQFVVTNVDGVPIDDYRGFDKAAVRAWSERGSMPAAEHGDVWELDAFEAGGFRGLPPNLFERLNVELPSQYVPQFVGELIYLSGTVVSASK